MKKQAEAWLISAQDDLLTIKEIIGNHQLTHIVAYHAQQAIEKCLKAIIETIEEEVPRIHNPITLKGITDQHVLLDVEVDIFDQINELYIDSRYPTDFGFLPDDKPSIDEAMAFGRAAESIFKQIKRELEQ